jgi:hypothetical protein
MSGLCQRCELGDGNRLQQRSGAQTERWKHDKYEEAKQSPTNEEEQTSQVERMGGYTPKTPDGTEAFDAIETALIQASSDPAKKIRLKGATHGPVGY